MRPSTCSMNQEIPPPLHPSKQRKQPLSFAHGRPGPTELFPTARFGPPGAVAAADPAALGASTSHAEGAPRGLGRWAGSGALRVRNLVRKCEAVSEAFGPVTHGHPARWWVSLLLKPNQTQRRETSKSLDIFFAASIVLMIESLVPWLGFSLSN